MIICRLQLANFLGLKFFMRRQMFRPDNGIVPERFVFGGEIGESIFWPFCAPGDRETICAV